MCASCGPRATTGNFAKLPPKYLELPSSEPPCVDPRFAASRHGFCDSSPDYLPCTLDNVSLIIRPHHYRRSIARTCLLPTHGFSFSIRYFSPSLALLLHTAIQVCNCCCNRASEIAGCKSLSKYTSTRSTSPPTLPCLLCSSSTVHVKRGVLPCNVCQHLFLFQLM